MTYLLDTNIVSAFDPRQHSRYADLLHWLRQNDDRLFISVITLFEIEIGRLKLVRENKVARAVELGDMRRDLQTALGRRVLPVDTGVALAAARLSEAARPHVVEIRDMMIAATAETHHLTVLTRNLRHFRLTGVPSFDPTQELPDV